MSDQKTNQKAFKNRRKLTAFLCREMLYDYEMGTLDEDRREAVEEFLKTDADCRNQLEGLRRGLKYGAELSKTSLHPEILAGLSDSENVVSLSRKYSSWRAWPDEMRWTLGFVAVSIVIAGLAVSVPWAKLKAWRPADKSNTLELAQISKPVEPTEKLEQQEGESPADQGSGDEEIEAPDQAAPITKPPSAVVAKNKVANEDEEGSNDEGEDDDAPKKASPKKVAKQEAAAAAESSDEESASTNQATADDESKEGKPKGFVYRAFMNTADLDEVVPKITEQIVELGGTKAGEVELGWKRGSGRYYHFALPEENQEKLLEKLRAYGPVRISKDPHSRVMPAGQVRFILWVEASH